MNKHFVELAQIIDFSILHHTVNNDDFIRECAVPLKYGVGSVFVKLHDGKLGDKLLKGSESKVGYFIEFSHPCNNNEVKSSKTEKSCYNCDDKNDITIKIGKLISGLWGNSSKSQINKYNIAETESHFIV
jgi:deoxyribose-phosphate aldolase